MALFSNTAATDESTPPDKPRTTLSLPIIFLRSYIVLSTNELAVQLGLISEILTKKFFNNFFPSEL